MTGASIQVAQESLPDSTERCVEVSGTGETCLQCVYHICNVLLEAPKRYNLTYKSDEATLKIWSTPGMAEIEKTMI